MTAMRHHLPSYLVLALAAWAIGPGVAQAQGTIKDMATSALNDLVQGKAPKQVPVTNPPDRNNVWGDETIIPRRGRAIEGLSPSQYVDERFIDDRYGVKDGQSRARATARTVVSKDAASDPPRQRLTLEQALLAEQAARRKGPSMADADEDTPEPSSKKKRKARSSSRKSMDDGMVAMAPLPNTQNLLSNASSCTNVSRAWEGAANFAEVGRVDSAYNAYVRLLSSCKTERELLGTVFQASKNLPQDSLFALLDEPVMGSNLLKDASYNLRTQLLYKLNRENKTAQAMKLADSLRDQAVERADANVLTIAGYLEMTDKRLDRAQSSFRSALRADRDNEKAREGLALAFLASGKPDAAWREADRLSSQGAERIRSTVRIAQARQAYDADEPKDALRYITEAEKLGHEMTEGDLALKAWSLKSAGQADKSSKIFAQLNRAAPDNKEYASGLIESYRSAGEFDKIERLIESPTIVGPMAQSVIADQYVAQGRFEEASAILGTPVEGGGAPVVNGTIAIKSKTGTSGAGKLTIVSAPEVAFSAPAGRLGRLTAAIGSLRLSDGVNDVTAREARLGFSTVGQTTIGVALALSTRLNSTFVGGDVVVRRYNAGGFNEVVIGSTPVYDSVRSYAGVIDAATGVLTGRTYQTSITLAGNQSINSTWKADYALAFGSVSGRNVASNGFFRTSLGGIRNLADYGMPWLSVGPFVSLGGYKEDQNLFTGTNGGYFSPKSDTGFGAKAFLAKEIDDRTIVRGSAYAGYTNRSFFDYSESGLQLEGDIAGSYLLNSSLIASGGLTMRTSPSYSDAAFWLALTVPFEKRTALNARDIIRPVLGIR